MTDEYKFRSNEGVVEISKIESRVRPSYRDFLFGLFDCNALIPRSFLNLSFLVLSSFSTS